MSRNRGIRRLVCSWGEKLISLSMLRNHLALEITEGRVPIVEVNRIENRVSSCRISQRFDSVAEVSECTDHSECAYSLGLLAYRRAAFLIANAFMQKDPDQLAQAVCNGPDGFIVPEARHQTTIEDLEDASFAFDGSIGSLIQNAAHLAVAIAVLRSGRKNTSVSMGNT